MTDDESRYAIREAEVALLEVTNQFRAMLGYPPLAKAPERPYCATCGRTRTEVGILIEESGAHICNECADRIRKHAG